MTLKQRRQSVLKTGGRGSGFETEGRKVLNVQQTERSTQHRIESIISGMFIYCTQIFLFMKSHRFGKCSQFSSHIPVHYRNIVIYHGDPYDPTHDPIPKAEGLQLPTPRIDAYALNN